MKYWDRKLILKSGGQTKEFFSRPVFSKKIKEKNYKKYVFLEDDLQNIVFKDIFKVYEKPSAKKIKIYNKYYDMLINLYNCDLIKYGIISHNCNFIIIGAIIRDADCKKWFIYITKKRNCIRPIVSKKEFDILIKNLRMDGAFYE